MAKVNLNRTNINEKIEFAFNFFNPAAHEKGLNFNLSKKLSPGEEYFDTDNDKVYSILSNLIQNAIKFTQTGSIEFGCEKIGNNLRFFVKDTGAGIPETHREHIFDRFRQGGEHLDRMYEGNGLGLSISKHYVEMLGGRIWYDSEVGKGTTFYFSLPYNGFYPKISGIKIPDKDIFRGTGNRKLKVLIVEDDELSYTLLIRMIQDISSEIFHASNGKEGVKFCNEIPDLDLVLMDIRMPLMDGLEATKRIREFNKRLIIIAQTAYGFTSDCDRALEAGCNDFISKPIKRNELIKLINKYCFKKSEQILQL